MFLPNVPPLSDAQCDLRDMEFMPLYGDRLLTSDAWILGSGEGCVAMVALWWAAWKQVPAGSLPDNDRVLAALAGYGRTVDAWMGVRAEVLRDFIKCSDGRLYHPELCELAMEIYRDRVKAKAKRKADGDRLREWRKRQKADSPKQEERSETSLKRVSNAFETRHETDVKRERNALPLISPNRIALERSSDIEGAAPIRVATAQAVSTAPGLPVGAPAPLQDGLPKPRPHRRARAARAGDPEGWADWWAEYPRGDAAKKAKAAYAKALANGMSPADLLHALRNFPFDYEDDGRFIPYGATWLNNRRWLDEPGLRPGIAPVPMSAVDQALAMLDAQEAAAGRAPMPPSRGPILDLDL